jgi:hypothetical protein
MSLPVMLPQKTFLLLALLLMGIAGCEPSGTQSTKTERNDFKPLKTNSQADPENLILTTHHAVCEEMKHAFIGIMQPAEKERRTRLEFGHVRTPRRLINSSE